MLSTEREIRDRFDMYRQDAEHYAQSNRERVVTFAETPSSDLHFQNTTQVVRPSFVPSIEPRDNVTVRPTDTTGQSSNGTTTRHVRMFVFLMCCSLVNFIIAVGAIVLGIITMSRLNTTENELAELKAQIIN